MSTTLPGITFCQCSAQQTMDSTAGGKGERGDALMFRLIEKTSGQTKNHFLSMGHG